MERIFKIVVISLFLVGVFSCKKSSTGGDAIVVAFPKHHGSSIKGATVYVKFKTNELPSNPTVNYDLKVEGDANEDHVHIKGLRYGKYYLYAVGYDSAISQVVRGGLPLTIKWKERKQEIDVDIAVTED